MTIIVHHADITFTCESMFIDENRHIARFYSKYWSTNMKNDMVFNGVTVKTYNYMNYAVEVFLEKCDEKNSGC